MKFFGADVQISESEPPEELLASVAGALGHWQVAVILISFIARYMSITDILAVRTSIPESLNYSCVDGGLNGSQCLNKDGSKCERFIFTTRFNVTTLSEQLKLVCEDEGYNVRLTNCYRAGLSIGFLITGFSTDIFGIKNTAAINISLLSFTGMLMISISGVQSVSIFVLTHGLFCTALNLIPTVAVCDVVGNKWRTFALGLIQLPTTIGFLTFPFIYTTFSRSSDLIATISSLPLVLLIPLLYYKNCPNYICFWIDFTKGEKGLRSIAKFNGCPMAPDARIRPVQILFCFFLFFQDHRAEKSSFFEIWRPYKTRKVYLAATCIWFITGYTSGTLMHYAYNMINLSTFGLFSIMGLVTAICLCHCFSHKTVIRTFAFFKTMFIVGLVIYSFVKRDVENFDFETLGKVASFLYFVTAETNANLIPRIFPTEVRATSVAFCRSVYDLGYLVASVLRFYTNNALWLQALLLLSGFILETVLSSLLWDVHNRELPDYLVDCVRFDRYYKPTRYYYIKSESEEIEVKAVNLTAISTLINPFSRRSSLLKRKF